jgi:hypothetical protein
MRAVLPGVRLLGPAIFAASTLLAPVQCTHQTEPEHRLEEGPAEALYGLAEKFKGEGDQRARAETLRYLVVRYPSSRYAVTAQADLDELDGRSSASPPAAP